MRGLKDIFVSLKVRNYRLFFMGQGVSLIGTWVHRTTMGWFVYRITNSAFLLGLVSFLSMIPTLFISPFAGAWSDRWNRHHTLVITQLAFMTQAGLLATLVLSGYINAQRIWPLIVLSLMQGMIEAVDAPIRQNFVMDLVSTRALIPNAIATNSAMFNSARLIGPSIGGAMIVMFSEGVCFAFNAISYLPVIVMLLMIKITYPPRRAAKEPILAKVLEGWKYAWQNFPIRYLITNLGIFTLFALSYSTLLPVFARNILKGTAQTQGLLLSVAGVGSLASAIYMASRKSLRGLPVLSMTMAAIGSTALIVFAQSHSLLLSMAMMLFIGWGMTLQMAATNTLIQSTVSDEMRGRVLSVYTMAFGSMTPFGALLIGSLTKVLGFGAVGEAARALGAQRALTICAALCLLWTIYSFRLIPALVKEIMRMLVKNKNVSIYRPAIVREQLNPGEL